MKILIMVPSQRRWFGRIPGQNLRIPRQNLHTLVFSLMQRKSVRMDTIKAWFTHVRLANVQAFNINHNGNGREFSTTRKKTARLSCACEHA